MNNREALVAFNMAANIGSVGVSELAAKAGSVVEAWERYPNKVSRVGGEIDWRKEFAIAERYSVNIITPVDEDYPKRLKEIPGHPLALYVKGSVKALEGPFIGIVGTRRATSYGLTVANSLGHDLALAGWGIVSGLAIGIDAEAHRGALIAGGVTVGVIGSGLDCFYPEENRTLAREIVASGGAVVSEFPFGRPPDKETFPIRNHTVAGIAQGIVAVEAPRKSGTLITTSIAADLNRTVMAVPGKVDSRVSAGCLELIREGAILVRNADDVLEEMNSLFPNKIEKKSQVNDEQAVAARDSEKPAYTAEEAMVMLCVNKEGVTLDEIAEETKLPLEQVNSIAMMLLLKGFVKFLPGNRIAG